MSKLAGFKGICGAARTWFESLPKDASPDDQWASCPNGAWLIWRLVVDPKIGSADSDVREQLVSIVQHCAMLAIDNAKPPSSERWQSLAQSLGLALLAEDPQSACDELLKYKRALPPVRAQSDAGSVRELLDAAISVVRHTALGRTREALAAAHDALSRGSYEASTELRAKFADVVRAHIPKVSLLTCVTQNAELSKEPSDHAQ